MCRRFGTLCPIFLGRLLVHMTYEDGTVCSKSRHIKFRLMGITQKKQYNIHIYIYIYILYQTLYKLIIKEDVYLRLPPRIGRDMRSSCILPIVWW